MPHNSIAGALRRVQEHKEKQQRDDLYWSFIGKTENAIASASGPLQSFLNAPHRLTPEQTVRTLAAYTIADLWREPQEGHIAIEVVGEPGRPMVNARTEICDDCPEQRSMMVKITFNLYHPYTKLWRHTGGPPEDVLKKGISTLADAAILLAFELQKDPNGVLYRSEFPISQK